MPPQVGTMFFGSVWADIHAAVVPYGLGIAFGMVSGVGFIVLRGLGLGHRVLVARLGTLPMILACPLIGAFLAGVAGYVSGLVVMSLLTAPVPWMFLRRKRNASLP